VLLVFGAPCQLQSLAGQEHGRTIPLTDLKTSCVGFNLAEVSWKSSGRSDELC
jgi:hypothetical protein